MVMKPKQIGGDKEYERVKNDEWLVGIIEEVQRDENRKTIWEGKEKISDCVRFKLKLDGYSFPHYSRWMTFSYGEMSNLYKKYLSELVDGAFPDMDFDVSLLNNLRVKTMWKTTERNGKSFQSLELIRPEKSKVRHQENTVKEEETEETPF